MKQIENIITKIKNWGRNISIVENKNMDIYMNKKKFEEMQSILDELKHLRQIKLKKNKNHKIKEAKE